MQAHATLMACVGATTRTHPQLVPARRRTEMVAYHNSHASSGHCTIMSVKARKDQAQSYGCIVASEDGLVEHYVEKVRLMLLQISRRLSQLV